MSSQSLLKERPRSSAEQDPRARLLSGIPAGERRLDLAGIPTAVLEGGPERGSPRRQEPPSEGSEAAPIVLLHGPGEFAAKWMRIIPELMTRRRVIAPDLPAHGASGGAEERLDVERVLAWLDELIERTCPSPPALVGHVLGGALAARFAVDRGDRIRALVLVDSLGLAPFRPSLRFALSMLAFRARPTERSYGRFMRQCSYDPEGLREGMGERWEPFVSYNLELARGPGAKAVGRLFREVGLPAIPEEDLVRITVPTHLIWGRHDRALSLSIAEAASARYGWPLQVIENCADDPPRDRPEAFLRALRTALAGTDQHGEETS